MGAQDDGEHEEVGVPGSGGDEPVEPPKEGDPVPPPPEPEPPQPPAEPEPPVDLPG